MSDISSYNNCVSSYCLFNIEREAFVSDKRSVKLSVDYLAHFSLDVSNSWMIYGHPTEYTNILQHSLLKISVSIRLYSYQVG